MTVTVRQETKKDYIETEAVVEEAFKNEEYTDHTEHFLVARLRKSTAFIPELSLVAEENSRIVGHVLLTRISIENDSDNYESLALAPVSFLPDYQNQGIGSKLILDALSKARELGYRSVIVMGHDKYYPRFGFKPASIFGIESPFEVPDEAFMALELKEDSLEKVSGKVVYSKPFQF
ncbi:GNAT family N-acetyltransferase [Desemzia sp. FAM 23991]|uniref:GNAT family N-acetyltransferase n=1 Tax=unclassified Desemzia TaxID=2685243 RepID=UPI003888E9CF